VKVAVRVYGPLVGLVGRAESEVVGTGPRSVKDAIEALGVPHTELALVLVDGQDVGWDHRLTGGERVAAYPPFGTLPLTGLRTVAPPPAAPRFALDGHLGTLARRLRLLGFDAWYRQDVDDASLAEVAVDEGRILLTRDRGLLMRRSIAHGYLPRSDDPDAQLDEVVLRYDLAQRLAPSTRCVSCNGGLTAVAADTVRHEVPDATRRAVSRFSRCERCGQVYWPGAHQPSIDAVIDRVRRLRGPSGPTAS
jgi:uncharacterized protein with PIN domain